jgi:hypothetical protein
MLYLTRSTTVTSPGSLALVLDRLLFDRIPAGTWVLTTEPVMEPPEKLREACIKAGLEEGTFDVCGLGETRIF